MAAMATPDDKPQVHQGLTDLLEMKQTMLRQVLSWALLLVGTPIALYLLVQLGNYVLYVARRILP